MIDPISEKIPAKDTFPLPQGGDKTTTTPPPQVASASDVEILKWVMIGVIIVLLVGYVTFVLQQFTASQTAFDSLKDQVTQQNAKIDLLLIEYGNSTSVPKK